MLGYVLRRVATSLPVFIGVVTITFLVAQWIPGDPLAVLLPDDPTPSQYKTMQRELGLDQPLVVQWARSLLSAITWDFGRSFSTRQPIKGELPSYFRATAELATVAFILAVVVGVPLGVLAAVREDTWTDHVLRVVTLGGVAAPLFWIALMVQLLFYGVLNWLPAGAQFSDFVGVASPVRRVTGFALVDATLTRNWVALHDGVRHLILPAAVLAYRVLAIVTRMTRATVVEVLRQDYVRTARAMGLPERAVLFRHVLRNAGFPILTVMSLAFGQLLQGSVLVETVFLWPGLGLYAVKAIANLDYPVIVAVSIVVTVVYVAINLLVDILYSVLDPRVRYA
jgi:peptide/nickel transport system permease protein